MVTRLESGRSLVCCLCLLAPGVFFRCVEITVPACYCVINAGGDEHAAVLQSHGGMSVARTVELGRRGGPGAGSRLIKFGAGQRCLIAPRPASREDFTSPQQSSRVQNSRLGQASSGTARVVYQQLAGGNG